MKAEKEEKGNMDMVGRCRGGDRWKCYGTMAMILLVPLVIYIPFRLFLSSKTSNRSLLSRALQPEQRDDGKARSLVANAISPSVDDFGLDFPLKYHPPGTALHSSIHCVGENFAADAWMYRSCQFRNLCLETTKGDFVVFPSTQEIQLQKLAERSPFTTLSTLLSPDTSSMSIGSLPKILQQKLQEWDEQDNKIRSPLQWFPRVVVASAAADQGQDTYHLLQQQGYYSLPRDMVMMPFHSSMTGNNDPENLIWHDFWPMFIVLQIFGLSDKRVLPVRYKITKNIEFPDRNTCDSSPSDTARCREMFEKYAAAFTGLSHAFLPSLQDFLKHVAGLIPEKQSPIICSPLAVAGMGMLSDKKSLVSSTIHGRSNSTHNHGQGAAILAFSRFLLRNLGIKESTTFKKNHPLDVEKKQLNIVLAVSSSHDAATNAFESDFQTLKKTMETKSPFRIIISVQYLAMDELPLLQQAEIAAQCSILVSFQGVGVAAATFLSPGSSLVLVDNSTSQTSGDYPCVAWNFLADAPYLRLHRISLGDAKGNTIKSRALIDLIETELAILQQEK